MLRHCPDDITHEIGTESHALAHRGVRIVACIHWPAIWVHVAEGDWCLLVKVLCSEGDITTVLIILAGRGSFHDG